MNDEQGILRRLDHYADCIEKGVHVTGTQLKSLVKDIRESGLVSSKSPPAEAQPVGDVGEFGVGIQPNPKARYWQERAEFWKAQAVALGWREKRDAANGETPPSAPVGVERILAEMREEGQADIVDGGVVLEWEDDLRNALAQQPPAEAQAQGGGGVVERVAIALHRAYNNMLVASDFVDGWTGWQGATQEEREFFLRHAREAVAAQPGGSGNDR